MLVTFNYLKTQSYGPIHLRSHSLKFYYTSEIYIFFKKSLLLYFILRNSSQGTIAIRFEIKILASGTKLIKKII